MANPFTSAQAPQTMAALPPDLAVEQSKLLRQQQMAELLRKQAMTPDGGTETVGGWAVKKSPLEGVNKIAQALMGGYMQKDADAKQTELGQKSNQQLVDGLQKFQGLMQGTPAETFSLPEGQAGPVGTEPAVPGNKQAALASLLQSGNPALQQLGMQQMLAKQESPFSKVDPKDFTQESVSKFASSQNYADLVPVRKREIAPSGVAYNPYDVKDGAVFNDPNKLINIGPDGAPVINQPLVGAKKDIARSGAANVNNTVSVAGPENQYNKDIGSGLAKEGLAQLDLAKQAPETIRNAQMIKRALPNAITGTGADARLAMQKALETAGLVGAGKAADTQALIAGLGKLTMAGIKTSGLGAGQGFTNTDREFLSSAISGTIDSTPENLRRVADLSERVARANYQKGTVVLNRWKTDPALKGVAQDTVLDQIPDDFSASPAPPSATPNAAAGKRLVYNPATGGFN